MDEAGQPFEPPMKGFTAGRGDRPLARSARRILRKSIEASKKRASPADAFCPEGPCPRATRKVILKVTAGKGKWEICLDKLSSPVIMNWFSPPGVRFSLTFLPSGKGHEEDPHKGAHRRPVEALTHLPAGLSLPDRMTLRPKNEDRTAPLRILRPISAGREGRQFLHRGSRTRHHHPGTPPSVSYPPGGKKDYFLERHSRSRR